MVISAPSAPLGLVRLPARRSTIGRQRQHESAVRFQHRVGAVLWTRSSGRTGAFCHVLSPGILPALCALSRCRIGSRVVYSGSGAPSLCTLMDPRPIQFGKDWSSCSIINLGKAERGSSGLLPPCAVGYAGSADEGTKHHHRNRPVEGPRPGTRSGRPIRRRWSLTQAR